jgi:hypothetical protein
VLRVTSVSTSRTFYVERVVTGGFEPVGTIRERNREFSFTPVPHVVLTEKDIAAISSYIQYEREAYKPCKATHKRHTQ